MKISRFLPLLTLMALAGAACAPDAADDDLDLDDDPIETEPATIPEEPVGMAPVTVDLNPLNDSGVMGQITLTSDAMGSRLEGQASGVTVGESLMGHIHRGTCASLEQGMNTAGEFGPVEIETDGRMDVELDLEDLAAGDYAISLHRNDGGPHVACADYTATAM
jgi:hypothetical protein